MFNNTYTIHIGAKTHCEMDTEQFRKYGKEMVDYICEYLETIKSRRVTPTVSPGWLKNKIPLEAPVQPESFDAIMEDVENIIMPGVRDSINTRIHIFIYIYFFNDFLTKYCCFVEYNEINTRGGGSYYDDNTI